MLRLVSTMVTATTIRRSRTLIRLRSHLQQVGETLAVACNSVLIERKLAMLQLFCKRISHEFLLLAFIGAG